MEGMHSSSDVGLNGEHTGIGARGLHTLQEGPAALKCEACSEHGAHALRENFEKGSLSSSLVQSPNGAVGRRDSVTILQGGMVVASGEVTVSQGPKGSSGSCVSSPAMNGRVMASPQGCNSDILKEFDEVGLRVFECVSCPCMALFAFSLSADEMMQSELTART